jgi:hypothetical protein
MFVIFCILDPFSELYETTLKYSARLENNSQSEVGKVIKIRASYDCPADCAKLLYKNDIYWFVQGSREYIHYECKQLEYERIENKLFTQLDEQMWYKYANKHVFCLIFPIINGKRSPIPLKTDYFFIGFVVEIDNKKVTTKSDKQSICIMLINAHFTED